MSAVFIAAKIKVAAVYDELAGSQVAKLANTTRDSEDATGMST